MLNFYIYDLIAIYLLLLTELNLCGSHRPDFPYTNNARLSTRYLVIRLFLETKNRTLVANTAGVSCRLVNEWVGLYLTDGIEALNIKKQPGRPEKQKEQLKSYVLSHAVKDSGGRLIAEDIRAYINTTFKIYYQLSNVYRLLNEMDLSWITSRSKHPKQSVEAQEEFKKLLTKTITTILGQWGLIERMFGFKMKYASVNKLQRQRFGLKKVRDKELSGSSSLSQLIYMVQYVQQ